jgi:sulfur-carrier protein adenylyltransferase/sulfurtransferase
VNIPRALGGAALFLGALAIVAGSPDRSRSTLNVKALAREVTDEADHVTAVELARQIRDQDPLLRVIDIRDSAEFEEYHIPRAERISLEKLADAPFGANENIVLYSGGGAHAAQAWVFLRARGLKRVFFLRGGIDEWLDEVMNPELPAAAASIERAYIDSVSALSRYFGGTPHVVDSVRPGSGDHRKAPADSWRASVARVRGRGC